MSQNKLLSKDSSILLIIDFQERLANVMAKKEEVENRIIKLVEIAHILNIPTIITEQYPKGLGPTSSNLVQVLEKHNLYHPMEKLHFSCFGSQNFGQILHNISNRSQLLITGIETHVCVLQTVFDACDRNMDPFLVSDATTSRTENDYHCGLERMKERGAQIVTFEMVTFEWLVQAGTPEFKAVHKHVV